MLKCNITIIQNCKELLLSKLKSNKPFVIHAAGAKYYAPQPTVDTSEWPKQRKLKVLEKTPLFRGNKMPKMPKMLKLLRGPEEFHTDLLYKCFGVKAVLGGRMRHEHFEFIRHTVNRALDDSRMFAIWRVDPPWQPIARRGVGKRMGCGKGGTHHYATPVKADRIVLELAGNLYRFEAEKILMPAVTGLPFLAKFVSQEDIDNERKHQKWVEENNLNPFNMEYIINNNMGGCRKWFSPYDKKFFGRYT